MRRLMAITAFALFLTVPVWAQHGGGGHGGGGGHAGGFGGGHAGGFSSHAGYSGGGHSSSGRSSGGSESGFGAHSYSGPLSQASPHAPSSAPSARFSDSRPLTARAGYARRAFQNGFRGNGFRNGFGNSRFRNGCYGYPCRYGYGYGNGYGYGWPWGWYAGYYDPYWWWDSDSNNDQDYYDNAAQADQMNQQNLQDQQMLQQEQADGDQDAYANPAPAAAPEKHGTAFLPPTVLVFRDQHKKEVDNYAIVGQTLWAFAPQHTEKIALADLDIAATVKVNDDRGITFRVPAASEAQ